MAQRGETSEDVFETNDEICQKLVEEFVSLTETDEALAQFYLQDRNWNLRASVNDYFEHISKQNKSKPLKRKSETIDLSSDDSEEDNECDVIFDQKPRHKQELSDGNTSSVVEEVVTDVNEFRFICWNIDGIDEKNLVVRTEAVSRFITQENTFIVFLQEVVPQSESILRRTLPDYHFLSGKRNSCRYYTLTAIHKKFVEIVDNEVIPFEDSIMERNLLKTRVRIGGALVCLLNTHLESTKDFAKERVNQLNRVFDLITNFPNNESIIFGGDLNLCDEETKGIPPGAYDVWIKTGARKEVEFTWDLLHNDNLQFEDSKSKSRFRFDRVFVRPSLSPKVEATNFDLIGLERLNPCMCFPSDHWGLKIDFNIRFI